MMDELSRRALLRSGGMALSVAGLTCLPVSAASAAVATPDRLVLGEHTIDPLARGPGTGLLANGHYPGPAIRAREGDSWQVTVANDMAGRPTSIHWHGLLLPNAMDGVAGITQAAIAPGAAMTYAFPVRQSGTYWYHAHVGLQEQQGLAGPIVIEAKDESLTYDHDEVIFITDWTRRSPESVYEALRAGGGLHGQHGNMKSDMAGHSDSSAMPAMSHDQKEHDAQGHGTQGHGVEMEHQVEPSAPMAAMAMEHYADVAYDGYLINGRGGHHPFTIKARPGDRIRLRVINAGASSFFRLSLDGHAMTVVHADGVAVHPVEVESLVIGMGETYDLLVRLKESGAFGLRAALPDGEGGVHAILHSPDRPAKLPHHHAMGHSMGRELRYGQLRALEAGGAPEKAAGEPRVIDLPLGEMRHGYVWSLGGEVYPHAAPLEIARGEWVRLAMTNDTSMWHPMHLHGHYFRPLLEGVPIAERPLKHTINIAPRQRLAIDFRADEPGDWLFHCHNLYHMKAGMTRVVRIT